MVYVISGPEYLMADTKFSFDIDPEFSFFLILFQSWLVHLPGSRIWITHNRIIGHLRWTCSRNRGKKILSFGATEILKLFDHSQLAYTEKDKIKIKNKQTKTVFEFKHSLETGPKSVNYQIYEKPQYQATHLGPWQLNFSSLGSLIML